ncbi:MAG TPA: sigma-70 family RNA polymerase sigma factor [Polyangiaceae bacterium]|nr:sigma-70 family RNA polymerase sigma factor [Polyangiaceae bacterium]
MDFRQVYDEHVAFVWRSLRRLGVAESALKDAVQDVFLVVHRRLPDFVESAKISTWLFRIAMGIARDHRQRAHVRREVFDDAACERWPDPGGDAGESAERREDLALFDRALAKVDLDQSAVFILFEIEDMTGDQIAETLAIPLGTVYSRLRLARQAFRRAVLQQAAEPWASPHPVGAT